MSFCVFYKSKGRVWGVAIEVEIEEKTKVLSVTSVAVDCLHGHEDTCMECQQYFLLCIFLEYFKVYVE